MRKILLGLLVLSGTAHAETLHYTVYATGLPAVSVVMTLDTTPDGYRIGFSTHTLGIVDVMAGVRLQSEAAGVWAADGSGRDAQPAHYEAHGRSDGVDRDTVIDYPDGDPVVRTLLPANDEAREPIPAALQARTEDGISAVAGLLHHVERTGRCDGAVRTFDGRRLSDTAIRTAGIEEVLPTSRSVFSGPALRCDFTGRLLAGFKVSENRARAARPVQGSIWLARVDGALVPVRLTFETRLFGDAVAYLSPPNG